MLIMNQNAPTFTLIYLIWDILKNLLIQTSELHMNLNIILKENIIIHFSKTSKAIFIYISKVFYIKGINLCLIINIKKLNLIQC